MKGYFEPMKSVKPFNRRSITFRMTMAVCAFVILFQSLMAALTLVYFKRELKQSISSQQFTLLTVASQDIDRKLKAAQDTLLAVSREVSPEIVNNPDAAQRWLDNRHGTRTFFDNGLFLISKEGRIIVETPFLPHRRGRDISFRQFYQKTIATGQPVISEPFVSTHTPNAPAVMFTVPIRDRNGNLIAILGGGLNLLRDNFLGEISRTRIAKTGYLFLCTNGRTMIMHPDKSRIMGLAAPPGANKLLDKALNGFEGGGENVNSRGLHALSSFKHLQTTDWILAANYPLAEAYEAVYRIQKYFVAGIISCAFLTVLVVRLMMGRFTSALVRFADHVTHISSKIGSGRLFPLESADGEIGILARTFNSMIQDQDRKSEELFHISTHDALSGLYNRAYFDTEVKRLSSGRRAPVSVVMADIDDLKVLNDTYGHSTGDRLIKTTARILLEAFRAEDVVARIGGDEFGVLLQGVDAEQAKIALKRIRRIADRCQTQAEVFPISISLGCATTESPVELEEAIKQADQQMYLDKVSRKTAEKETVAVVIPALPDAVDGPATDSSGTAD